MKFRLANVVNDSIVDGPGFRLTVFVQGCPHRCPGCHNPQTHDPAGGRDADTDWVLEKAAENPLLSGITLSGGEPFAQCEPMAALARGAKEMGLHVMAYSGYTFEQLLSSLLSSLLLLTMSKYRQNWDLILTGSNSKAGNLILILQIH